MCTCMYIYTKCSIFTSLSLSISFYPAIPPSIFSLSICPLSTFVCLFLSLHVFLPLSLFISVFLSHYLPLSLLSSLLSILGFPSTPHPITLNHPIPTFPHTSNLFSFRINVQSFHFHLFIHISHLYVTRKIII